MVSYLRDLITFPATYPGLKPGATICIVPTEQGFVMARLSKACSTASHAMTNYTRTLVRYKKKLFCISICSWF